MEILELDYVDIQRLIAQLEAARTRGSRVRVAWQGGLQVKVAEGVWSAPMGRPEVRR